MIAALAYEWTRIRTIRSTYWLSVVALVFGVGLSFLVSMGLHFSMNSAQPPRPSEVKGFGQGIATQFAVFGVPYFVAYILAMVAVFSWGHEYRHGMVRATLTALSSRTSSWVAKFVVVGVWVVGATLLTTLLSMLAGWFWLHGDGIPVFSGGTWGAVARAVLYALVFSWLAAAFTALVRNQTAALVLLFLWPLAVENVVSVVFTLVPALRDHSELTRFLPFNAGGRIISQIPHADGFLGDPLSLPGAVLIFGGLTCAAMAASLALFHRRDA
jgi:ABC-type transport system involved in multi-copper enzyme maturation permease subunit